MVILARHMLLLGETMVPTGSLPAESQGRDDVGGEPEEGREKGRRSEYTNLLVHASRFNRASTTWEHTQGGKFGTQCGLLSLLDLQKRQPGQVDGRHGCKSVASHGGGEIALRARGLKFFNPIEKFDNY